MKHPVGSWCRMCLPYHLPIAARRSQHSTHMALLQALPRPFKKLRELDMEVLVAEIVDDLKKE
jgi:hypothetical protein